MLNGLLNTHPSPLLILQTPQSERESTSLLLNLGKDLSTGLHLELIVDVRISLVNRRPRFFRLSLAVFSSDDENIDTPNFTLLESLGIVIPTLFGRRVQDDSLFTIGDVLFVNTREHSLDRDTRVILGYLLYYVSDAKVLEGGFDGSHLPGCKELRRRDSDLDCENVRARTVSLQQPERPRRQP
jgi:hypothetical protein